MTTLLKSALAAPPELADAPTVSLHGPVDDGMLSIWLDALATARSGSGPPPLPPIALQRGETGAFATFL
jgi:hypothetical protein